MSKVGHRVSHSIAVGDTVYSSSDNSRLIVLDMQASLNVPVNSCRFVLGPVTDIDIALNDTVTVELGYDDELALCFTGLVDSVEKGIDSVSVEALSVSRELLTARFNLSFEDAKAGDIVSDITGRLDVTTASIEDGNDFHAFAIDDNHSAYDHLAYLARINGFDLYTDTEDKLVFAPYDPPQVHSFEYGANIISLTLNEPVQAVTGVEVYGESPAGHGQGADAYSWLTKQEVKGTAGDTAANTLRLREPALKDQDSTGAVAEALLERASSIKSGSLQSLGCPDVSLGDGLEIASMPDDSVNDTYRITGIRHCLNKQRGFVTTVAWAEV